MWFLHSNSDEIWLNVTVKTFSMFSNLSITGEAHECTRISFTKLNHQITLNSNGFCLHAFCKSVQFYVKCHRFLRAFKWKYTQANGTFIDEVVGEKNHHQRAVGFVFKSGLADTRTSVNVKYNFRFQHIDSNHAFNVNSSVFSFLFNLLFAIFGGGVS